MDFIKGKDRGQTILFPERIEEYVEENSPVRVIDAYINSINLIELEFVRPRPKDTGRPPYDSKDLLKLYVYGNMHRIRSSRRLEAESKRNVEVMWLLCKLTPDHKTISDFRKNNKKALKNVFKDFVRLCVKLDLYGKELAAIDGSKFKAVNSKRRNFTKGSLKDRLERIDNKIDEYLNELDKNDRAENSFEKEKTAEDIKRIIDELRKRKTEYQGYAEEMEETGETQKSLTDPDSRLMQANGKMEVCYNVQTAVDSKNKLIAEFDVINKTNDLNQITPMAEQVKEILELKTIAITADAGYASASDIAAAIQIGIEPHVANTDYHICIPTEEDNQTEITPFSNGKIVYVKDRNIAVCPMGKTLYPGYYTKNRNEAVFYNWKACKECTHRCTKQESHPRCHIVMKESDFTKDYNDKNLFLKQIHIKPKKEIYDQRKSLSEHPFGTIKRAMDGYYCLLKGKPKIIGELSLVFLAYNLKRVINILGTNKLLEILTPLASPV